MSEVSEPQQSKIVRFDVSENGDPVCTGSGSFSVHTSFAGSQYQTQSINFAVDKLQAAGI